MVPDRECSTPTLISATAWLATAHIIALAIANFFITHSLSSLAVQIDVPLRTQSGENSTQEQQKTYRLERERILLKKFMGGAIFASFAARREAIRIGQIIIKI
jgi:hypothetical protein